jgi:hypothetical protein
MESRPQFQAGQRTTAEMQSNPNAASQRKCVAKLEVHLQIHARSSAQPRADAPWPLHSGAVLARIDATNDSLAAAFWVVIVCIGRVGRVLRRHVRAFRVDFDVKLPDDPWCTFAQALFVHRLPPQVLATLQAVSFDNPWKVRGLQASQRRDQKQRPLNPHGPRQRDASLFQEARLTEDSGSDPRHAPFTGRRSFRFISSSHGRASSSVAYSLVGIGVLRTAR